MVLLYSSGMFIRVKTTKNSPKRSVQIVESYRTEAGKVRQRIVRHMGTGLSDKEVASIRSFAEYVKADLESRKSPGLFKVEQLAEMAIEAGRNRDQGGSLKVNLRDIREDGRITVGVHEAFGKIYDQLGFDNLLGVRKASSSRNLRNIVMARISNPASKRGSVADLAEDFGINISLDSVYRMMDAIEGKVIDKARGLAYQSARQLLGEEISLLFYDCTTLYFESFTEDDLKRCGYSKDMKFNQPQVVLGLLVTSEGLPVGYEVFPGNQFEGSTLEVIIPDIVNRYNLKRVIFTADSAMLNKSNLDYLERLSMEYIVGARLKSLPDKWKQAVTQTEGYARTDKPGVYEKLRSFDYGNGRKLVVTYSEKLARKNKYDRDKAIEKLRKKLAGSSNPASLISNYGYKRFITITGRSEVRIDEEKYAKAAEFDGLHGVITNVKDLSDHQAVEHYRCLWQIEDCFRVSKHDLKIRPIYHWTPRRIRSHILICFLALVCVRHLSHRLKLRFGSADLSGSPARMINALNHVQLSILRNKRTDSRYILPSKFNDDAQKIYKALGLDVSTTPYPLD